MTSRLLLYTVCIFNVFYITCGSLGPVKNFTTITLYTDEHTWSEADAICKMEGGQLLDIIRYSMFRNLLKMVLEPPWQDLPIANGPQAWLGLHRRITPLGDWYYSRSCVPLQEYKVVYWGSTDPYYGIDGDPTSYCVAQNFPQSTSGTTTTTKHDYTRAQCNERHGFYCQTENGQCTFEKLTRTLGDTRYDFSPGNDVTYAFESEAKCKELCLEASDIYPHPDLMVIEECWGFSITASDCILHIVVTPSYFDSSSSKIVSSTSDLFIKKCYQAAVNTDKFNVTIEDSIIVNTTCGIPVTGISRSTTREVFIYPNTWTWNDGYNICTSHGYNMITITNIDSYTAIKQIADDYVNTQIMDYIWLGLHEPDPINHTAIRVWSDCSVSGLSNWDSNSPPSTDISNTNWCVIMNTDTSLWYTVECNSQHYVLCLGDLVQNKSYSSGILDTTGTGTQLGPYNVSQTACEDMCSQWTYQDAECWGYSITNTGPDLNDCFLFFSNFAGVTASSQGFTFYQKQIWKATYMNDTDLSTLTGDGHLIPKSCCDVTGQFTQCPDNIVPSTNNNIPTATKTRLVFHQTLASWNEANIICTSTGGTLLQVDDVTKRAMLLNYINDWTDQGLSFTDVWIGLSQTREDDPCSLRWSRDCSIPGWVDFAGTSFESDVINRCVSADSSLTFKKQSCNVRQKFVCEINMGPCTFSNINNVRCAMGPDDGIITLTTTTCTVECSTQTYQGMECWAASMASGNTCYLYFYKDPLYCTINNGKMMSYDTVYKECYEAAVEDTTVITSPDEELIPNHGCDTFLPHSSVDYTCDTLTTTTTTSTVSSTSLTTTPTVGHSSTTINTLSTTDLPMSSSVSMTSPTEAVTSAADLISSTTESVTSPTEAVTSTTKVVTSTTEEVMSTTVAVTSTTEVVTSTTEKAMATTEYVKSSTETVTSTTEHIMSTSSSVVMSSNTVMSPSTRSSTSATNPSSIRNTSASSNTPVSTTTATLVTTSSNSIISTSKPSFKPAKPIYIVACMCHNFNVTNMTLDEWRSWLDSDNKVEAHNTSRYRRSLISVYDGRISTVSIGASASFILLSFALYLVLSDMPRLIREVIQIFCRRKLYITT